MVTLRNSIARTALLCAVVAALSGCARVTHEGQTTVFTWAAWVPVLVALGGIAGIVLGGFLMMVPMLGRWGFVLAVTSAMACVFIPPEMYSDRVTVNPERFTLRTGLWWAPVVHDVEFAHLTHIDLALARRSSPHDKEYNLVCFRKGGGHAVVPVSDLMKQGALARILHTAREHGVRVFEPRHAPDWAREK